MIRLSAADRYDAEGNLTPAGEASFARANLARVVALFKPGDVVVDVINRGAYVSGAYPADPSQRIESPWYTGELGLVLADVRPLPFVPLKGALGFFEVPDSLVPEALK